MAEMEKKPTKTRRREKKNVPVGQVHIAASFNNTVISITDPTGAVLSWGSGGVAGFKGSRKSTPYAASLGAEAAARKAMEHGLRSVEVFVKGPGAGLCNHRCDAAATQRLPSSEEAPSLGGERHGSRYWSSLPTVPPRGGKALLEGRALLHQEVLV